MYRYTHHRRSQHAAVEYVAGLIHLQDGAVFGLVGFRAIDCLMKMRIEMLADRLDALDAELGEVVEELLVDQLETLAVIFVGRLAVRGEGMLETVNDGNERFDHPSGIALGIFGALSFDALAVIIEVGLAPQQRLPQILQIGG